MMPRFQDVAIKLWMLLHHLLLHPRRRIPHKEPFLVHELEGDDQGGIVLFLGFEMVVIGEMDVANR